VPQTGIVDYVPVTEAYAGEVRQKGGEILLGAPVRRIAREGGGLVLETGAGEVRCRYLVNCAGLQSDRVARLAGVEPGVRIVPFRGEYYELLPERRDLVRNLIYPVPDPELPFLGVHFTRMIAGGVEAGPNAVLASARGVHAVEPPRDLSTPSRTTAFMMAGAHWRMGIGEIWRVVEQARVRKGTAGADARDHSRRPAPGARRARPGRRSRRKAGDDFRIVEAERQIHVLNAPSPAATASIAIGEGIADVVAASFGLG
jgi:L-2-hydroxyglutarate oxidase